MFPFIQQEQYVFLHEAILELMLCKDTRIPVAQFEQRFAQLKEKEPNSSKTNLASEFHVSVGDSINFPQPWKSNIENLKYTFGNERVNHDRTI